MHKIFNSRTLLGTLFILGLMWLFSKFNLKDVGELDAVNVLKQAFENFELSDVYYKHLRSPEEVTIEDRVVLVNIANLPRKAIAAQIGILSQHNPKVMGIDAKFMDLKEDTVGDQWLAEAIANAPNFVLATVPENYIGNDVNEDTEVFDSLVVPPAMFTEAAFTTAHVHTGLPNKPFVTWRSFPPFVKTKGGKVEPFLALKMAQLYDSAAAQRFIDRGNFKEEVYFKGDYIHNSAESKFFALDAMTVLEQNFDPSAIEGKIVLLGYMGPTLDGSEGYGEDMFFTPLNESIGRGYPDMYGVVVHANVISQILDGKEITTISDRASIIFAVLLCFFNVVLFTNILYSKRFGVWYNPLTKLIQLLQILVIAAAEIFIFDVFLYQGSLAIALIVVVLVGDLTEIFNDVVYNGLRSVFSKKKQLVVPAVQATQSAQTTDHLQF